MQLNETTVKIDGQLDSICKKLEKCAFETGSDKLEYSDEINEQKGKPTK